MKNNNKTDRRVKYTKFALRESLIQLLQSKPISKITIKEICEAADINRSTFYVHYGDQYELMRQIERDFLDDIYAYLDKYDFKGNSAESFQMLSKIFEYVIENAELCKVLLGEHGDIALQKRVMMIVQQQSMREWQGKFPIDNELHEYLLFFGVNGSIGIVQKWLQDGMKKSAQEMAEIVTRLIFNGLSSYIENSGTLRGIPEI